jgi:predicted small lipoprotein YifL
MAGHEIDCWNKNYLAACGEVFNFSRKGYRIACMKKVSLRVMCGFYIGIFGLAGCGQTGPLYLPEQAKPAVKSAAGDAPTKKQSASAASQTLPLKPTKIGTSETSSSLSSTLVAASSAATSSK